MYPMILLADAQADLALLCPYLSEDTYSHGGSQINIQI